MELYTALFFRYIHLLSGNRPELYAQIKDLFMAPFHGQPGHFWIESEATRRNNGRESLFMLLLSIRETFMTAGRKAEIPAAVTTLLEKFSRENGMVPKYDGQPLSFNLYSLSLSHVQVQVLFPLPSNQGTMGVYLLPPLSIPVPRTTVLPVPRTLASHVTVSSSWNPESEHGANRCALHFRPDGSIGGVRGGAGAWCTGKAGAVDPNKLEYATVDCLIPSRVIEVITQGRAEEHERQWVTRYKLSYSYDGYQFYDVGEYNGNTDANTPVHNAVSAGVRARYWRLSILACQGHQSLRFGFVVENDY